jgi:hypothetical protein
MHGYRSAVLCLYRDFPAVIKEWLFIDIKGLAV